MLKEIISFMICLTRQSAPASRNSDDAETSDGDSESPCDSGPAIVGLTLERLQCLQTDEMDDELKSEFARTGCSKTRVANVLRNPCCPCRCVVPIGILLKVVTVFWSLCKAAQDSLLWALQNESGVKKKKRQWYIQGKGFTHSNFIFYT